MSSLLSFLSSIFVGIFVRMQSVIGSEQLSVDISLDIPSLTELPYPDLLEDEILSRLVSGYDSDCLDVSDVNDAE